jgi:uroporphyrinogen-III synthase
VTTPTFFFTTEVTEFTEGFGDGLGIVAIPRFFFEGLMNAFACKIQTMANAGFGGLKVLSLESRRAKEIGQLISNNGGNPMVAPSTREVPAGPNDAELKFAADLQLDKYGAVILLTGVGTRALALAIESVLPREQFVAALSRTKVVARGPKPVAVLREFGVPVALAVPEPNTWREILQSLDQNLEKIPLKGQVVAVQEYGVPSPELYAGLRERGAEVFPVPVYTWQPPEDTGPLREAIKALSQNEIDVSMFTSSVQIHHLFQFADEMNLRDAVLAGLRRSIATLCWLDYADRWWPP